MRSRETTRRTPATAGFRLPRDPNTQTNRLPTCGNPGLASNAIFALSRGCSRARDERGNNDTSRQGRYHNRRFHRVAEELGLQVQRDSAFGWTQTELRASTAAAYSGVLKELALYVPRARSPSAAADGNGRARGGVRTLSCPCGHRLIRNGQSRFLADATICSGCLAGATSAGSGWCLSTCC